MLLKKNDAVRGRGCWEEATTWVSKDEWATSGFWQGIGLSTSAIVACKGRGDKETTLSLTQPGIF